MPLVWRFLLFDYFKVLGSSTVLFVMLLLAMRLEELAQFAALGASSHYLLTFIWYQLAFIFPIALPLSALISALLLMRRFSESGELMALRALGFSILDIATPLLLAASFLALVNFFILSEVATQADMMKHTLKRELQALNPLVVLQNEKLTQLKGIYTKTFGHVDGTDGLHDTLLCVHHKSNNCLYLLIAKELRLSDSTLIGKDVTIWSPMGDSRGDSRGDSSFRLMVENSALLELPRPNIPELFQGHAVKLEHDHAPFADLVGHLLRPLRSDSNAGDESYVHAHPRSLARIVTEIMRRSALGFSIWSFTLLGIVYGVSIQRMSSITPLVTVLMLTTLYICSVLFAKKVAHHTWLAQLSYLVPQLLMIICSMRTLRRIEKGL